MVANSPGLIAGSNVLHRLLMPRHPPCALHSLSQQRQNNTHKETHQSTPQSKRQTSQATDPLKTRKSRQHTHTSNQTPLERRCNWLQMLASTMQISNNNPTNPLTHHHQASHLTATRALGRREEPEDPTTTPPPHRQAREADTADPSGPNSVFNHPPTNVRQTPSIAALTGHS